MYIIQSCRIFIFLLFVIRFRLIGRNCVFDDGFFGRKSDRVIIGGVSGCLRGLRVRVWVLLLVRALSCSFR